MQMNSENDLEQESREKIAEAAGKPEQPRKEMRRNIRRASNRKILRRQMELLAEYSRTGYQYDRAGKCRGYESPCIHCRYWYGLHMVYFFCQRINHSFNEFSIFII